MIITEGSKFPESQDPLVFYEDLALNEWDAYENYVKLISQGRFNDANQYIKDNDIDYISAELWNMFQERIRVVQEYLLANVVKVYHHKYDDEVPEPDVTPTIWTSSAEI